MINSKSILMTLKKVENFITDEYLQKRIILGCKIDDNFNKDTLKYISLLKNNINAITINSLFTEIHLKSLNHLNLVKKNKNATLRNGYTILLSLSYFYLLEAFDEHCKLNDKTIKKIKDIFGKEYLKVIATFDKNNLSEDMKKIYKNNNTSSLIKTNVNEECINKYIVFKKWQDLQHDFYFDELEEYSISLLKQCFKNIQIHNDLEQDILKKLILDKIINDKIVDIDSISLLVKLGMKEEVINLFGGKSYGLAKLNSINVEIPWTVVIPIGKNVNYEELDEKIPKEIKYFSVRSSADIEDGENHSFAGMFDSYLNVSRNDLIENIQKVKNSIYNNRLKSYISKNNLTKPKMAVILEKFVEPQFAGVWMGSSLSSGLLEYTNGNGDKLVSGKVIPKREVYKKNYSKDNYLKVNGKNIGDIFISIQKKLKVISDFEWMILDKKLILLQFRPVTTKVKQYNYKKGKISKSNVIRGIPCSSGRVEGTIQFLNSPKEDFKEGNILLAWITDPEWIPHMMKAKGIITASGGLLCHAGIISRELDIPCVTGVGGDVVKKLSIKENVKVILDGDNGTITFKE